MNIPLCIPNIGGEEISIVTEVLKSRWLAHGPKNKEFEENFASYIGTKYAISLNSCTSALQLALQANNITGEVIVPSFTFIASANSIITAGAKPVLVDIDYDTCNIDPNIIEEAITKNTQAIMPVHFGGLSCNMDAITKIAQKHNLKIIEDSAETLGGTFKNKKTGSFGIGCFSFYPTKNLTTGEGGMLTTDDEEVYENIKALRAHGITSTAHDREQQNQPWFRSATYPGYNYRLCDILASIGLVQLKKLDEMNNLRIRNSHYLTEHLKDIEEIDTPTEQEDCTHVFQMYTIKVKQPINRNEFVLKLRNKGIQASVHFDPPVHKQKIFKNILYTNLTVTERVANSIVTLPMFPQLTKEQLDYMIINIKEIISSFK